MIHTGHWDKTRNAASQGKDRRSHPISKSQEGRTLFYGSLLGAFLGLVPCPAQAQIKRLADLPSGPAPSFPGSPGKSSFTGSASPQAKGPSLPSAPQGHKKPLPEETLRSLLMAYLEDQGFSDMDLLFDGTRGTVLLDYEDPGEIQLQSCSLNDQQTRLTAVFSATLAPGMTVTLSATLDPLVEVPALSRVPEPDHPLSADDLHFIKVPARKLSRQSVTKIEALLGCQVRPSAARPNRILRQSDLSRPQLVKRGQTVALSVKHRRLGIQTTAKALEKGEKGQRIRLLNPDTNQAIHAVVVAPGQAEIDLTPPEIDLSPPAGDRLATPTTREGNAS